MIDFNFRFKLRNYSYEIQILYTFYYEFYCNIIPALDLIECISSLNIFLLLKNWTKPFSLRCKDDIYVDE